MLKLICMRGVPGSGKSTKAEELRKKYEAEGWTVHVFSTDDFWGEEYNFVPAKIREAHLWNQNRTFMALMEGWSRAWDFLKAKTLIIIVDNTNVQSWEMQPYIKAAKMLDYDVEIVEADTPWAFDAQECASRNVHKVPLATIEAMLARWEKDVTVEKVYQAATKAA